MWILYGGYADYGHETERYRVAAFTSEVLASQYVAWAKLPASLPGKTYKGASLLGGYHFHDVECEKDLPVNPKISEAEPQYEYLVKTSDGFLILCGSLKNAESELSHYKNAVIERREK